MELSAFDADQVNALFAAAVRLYAASSAARKMGMRPSPGPGRQLLRKLMK